jgi:serine protease inhibitor
VPVAEKSARKNFVLSPYSAHSAFSQLLLGSGGSTEAELQKILGRL